EELHFRARRVVRLAPPPPPPQAGGRSRDQPRVPASARERAAFARCKAGGPGLIAEILLRAVDDQLVLDAHREPLGLAARTARRHPKRHDGTRVVRRSFFWAAFQLILFVDTLL